MEVKSAKVWAKKINVDSALVPRVGIDKDTADRYSELEDTGIKLPPLDVFEIKGELFLVDGMHRFRRHQSSRRKVEVNIHKGTRSEAIWFAAGANQAHGLPLTAADRARSVQMVLADPKLREQSDRNIARHCMVSPTTVGHYREKLKSTVQNGQSDEPADTQTTMPFAEPETRIGADGREINVANIGRKPSPRGGDADADADRIEPEVAEAAWPESIKDRMLKGTETLKDLASDCRKLGSKIKEIEKLRWPGTEMFHAGAALERVRRLNRAITGAIPHCVCADCKGEGCGSCGQRGWRLRTELDENLPTEKQLTELAGRNIDAQGMSKAEASRRLEDIFVVEPWQKRRARKEAIQEPQEAMSW